MRTTGSDGQTGCWTKKQVNHISAPSASGAKNKLFFKFIFKCILWSVDAETLVFLLLIIISLIKCNKCIALIFQKYFNIVVPENKIL